jgi:hypothetical protein
VEEAGWAGLRPWAEKEGAAHQGGKIDISFCFLPKIHSNAILNHFKVVSKLEPKREVVQKNILYNFVKRS